MIKEKIYTLRRNCFFVGCGSYILCDVTAKEWQEIMDSPNGYACDWHRKKQAERKRRREIDDHLASLAEQGCY